MVCAHGDGACADDSRYTSRPRLDSVLRELRCRDLAGLVPKLPQGLRERLDGDELTVTDLIVAARWLGISPTDIWADT